MYIYICLNIYIYIYICIHTYIHTCTCIISFQGRTLLLPSSVYVCICMHVYVCMYIYTHIYTILYIYIYMYIYIHTYIYTCIYVIIYIYIHTHTCRSGCCRTTGSFGHNDDSIASGEHVHACIFRQSCRPACCMRGMHVCMYACVHVYTILNVYRRYAVLYIYIYIYCTHACVGTSEAQTLTKSLNLCQSCT